jgi:DNA-binding XRE family transcriptional regulator
MVSRTKRAMLKACLWLTDPQHQGFALLPFAPICRKALKPKSFPEVPQTLGDHLKRAALTRQLTQKQLARLLGVSPFTVLNWEKNRTTPLPARSISAIVKFLGV